MVVAHIYSTAHWRKCTYCMHEVANPWGLEVFYGRNAHKRSCRAKISTQTCEQLVETIDVCLEFHCLAAPTHRWKRYSAKKKEASSLLCSWPIHAIFLARPILE